MCSPQKSRAKLRIILRVIISRNFNFQSFTFISLIFSVQCHPVIFRMSHNKNLTPVRSALYNYEYLLLKLLYDGNGVPETDHQIHAPGESFCSALHARTDRTFSLTADVFSVRSGNTVPPARPSKMNSGCYMTFAPLHDLRQFFPIIHFFKLHLFYRCSGNDHTVKFLFFHLFKAYIKLIQMASGSILCFMTRHCHKGHINLQRCVGQRSEQLKFCLFLGIRFRISI